MKRSEKIIYELDPMNRLVFAKTGKKSNLPLYRRILDGRIKIEKDNTFTYRITDTRDSDVPKQVKLSGKWSLDKKHNLILTLDRQSRQYAGSKLKIKGEMIDAKSNKLVFAVSTKTASNTKKTYILELGGTWHTDKYNRLSFSVKKEDGTVDKLTLSGNWEVGKGNQIIYTYEATRGKRKKRIKNIVTLKGYWDITEKHRIIYVLNKQINSRFDFKVSAGKPLKRGLQYELGIGSVPSKKRITLFGNWKVNKRLSVLFEMPYEKGKIKRVVFGATCRLSDGYNLDFRLKNNMGKDLGIDVKLSKKILKDQGEIFLRGISDGEEKQIVFGAGWRW